MKISFNWLKQYISPSADLNPDHVAELLTHCGLEVESIEQLDSIKGGLVGVVIGQVKSVVQHPNADRLKLTKVDVGEENLLDIVCGAPNVAEGQKVLVARVGSVLYPGDGEILEIKKSKIRGEVSEGMLCAEDELGLGKSHDGIVVLPEDLVIGSPAADHYGIKPDHILEIGLTPNRNDATSHIGVARDLVAVMNAKEHQGEAFYTLILPSIEKFEEGKGTAGFSVIVEDIEKCPRYMGIRIDDVNVASSPDWLQQKLKFIGLKPVNNIVDITNFVLHETGHPLHAFDAGKIVGKVVKIKTVAEGSKFIALDESEKKLSSTDLMICDENSTMCIAGVYGGLNSGVTEITTQVFLESAFFNSQSIRKTVKLHDLHTDAAYRYERGVDPKLTPYALKRAALLIQEIAGGKIVSAIFDNYPQPVENALVNFNMIKAEEIAGVAFPDPIFRGIMRDTGIEILKSNEEEHTLSVPTGKVDVNRQIDIVEELLRIYGYDKVELKGKLNASMVEGFGLKRDNVKEVISNYLSSNGFYEIMANSLTKSSNHIGINSFNEKERVKILNPLSQDLDVLRQTMLFSGLEVLEYNKNRRAADLRLYEFGKTYHKAEKGYVENTHLSLFMNGNRESESWSGVQKRSTFYYLKSFVVNVFERLGLNENIFLTDTISDELFSQGLVYKKGEKVIASFGLVQSKLAKKFDLGKDVLYADLNWDALLKYSSNKDLKMLDIPKYPEVRRDLSLLLDKKVSYSMLKDAAYRSEKKLLVGINLFDIYEGDKIEAGKKSYAVSFNLRDDNSTLNDKQIDACMERLMKTFESEFGAIIRRS